MEALPALSISQEDLDAVLRMGTAVNGGKRRIYERYQEGISTKDAVKFLKQEYGESWRGLTLQSGVEIYADSRPSKGLVIWQVPGGTEVVVNWTKVEKRLRQLIQEGTYLTLEEYRSIHQEHPPIPHMSAPEPLTISQMNSYNAVKAKHPDDIVLYQIGGSFEIYGEDTRNAATLLKLALTTRPIPGAGRIGMCAFPVHELDESVRKLRERFDVTVSSMDDNGKRLTVSYLSFEHEAARARKVEAESADSPGKTAPVLHEVTQADIDAALQEWNGDIASKRRVQQYMAGHARERDTASWLRNECGDDLPAFPVNGEHSGTDLSWAKVQRHLARLIKEDRFFTEAELDNFDDVDTAAVREQLRQGKPSAFAEQAIADVEHLNTELTPTVREIYEHYKPLVQEIVLADEAYRNACVNSDYQTAVIEGHAAIERAAKSFIESEDMTFVRLYFDMPDFRFRLHREIIDETYQILSQSQLEQSAAQVYEALDVPENAENGEESPPWGTEIGNHSPWGKVQISDQFADGVYEIGTPSHGGIMIREADAKNLLSPETLSAGGAEYGWRYYEEDEAAPIVIRELLDKGIPANPPFVRCEYSETRHLKADKIYSVSEFDRLMKQADDEHTAGEAAAMKKYGTKEKWSAANDPEFDRFIGYDKVSFCVVLPDGMRIWARQDVGDGYGGMLDYLSQNEKYRDIVPILRQAVEREQKEALPPDPSGQPMGSGGPAHETDAPPSDEGQETVQKVIGAEDQPPRDPLAPAYQVGDTVYLEKKPYVIADIYPSSVSLQDISQTYPIFRSESKAEFESALILDSRNGSIKEFLPANLETCDQDMREVLVSHLFTDRDKHYISGWFRNSEGNRAVAHRLLELFADRAETVELETGDKADYFTSTISIEINILDKDDNPKYALINFWSETAALLRGLWLQELDGFAHDPPPLNPAHLEGTPSYAVGDHVVFPTHDRDVSGTIEYIGEFDVRIDTGPYAWSHQTVNKDFFEDALRQDERNAGLFVREAPAQDTPEIGIASENTTLSPGDKGGEPPHLDRPEHAQPEPPPAVEQATATENFHITDDNLGVGGPIVKYRMNVEAIRTLKQIEMEGRSATAEEQEILSRYVGWGGVPDAFDKNKADWVHEYDELKELLTPEEYKSAMASTLNAHYTSPMIIKAIYEAVGNMGFETGKILEPSCGVGNFFGLLPESMSKSKLFGVELDSITGRIAQQLYPKANIVIKGFEKTNFLDGFFDLAIGNVPFGNYKVVDPHYNSRNFLIHDYFFAKTIDKVRPGGVIAFITSNGISGGTMDKKDDRARQYMAQRCDLLGAVRLPDGTFQANAGTDTSMSIVFLQKRAVPLRGNDPLPNWVTANVIENHTYIGKDGEEHPGFVSMNRYFQEHPEMVLGDLKIISGPFGPQLVCRPREGTDFTQQLHEAISRIHGEIARVETPEQLDMEPAEETEIPADLDVKEGSYAVIGGDVYYREDSKMVKPELSAAAKGRIMGMVELRDCVHRLIDLQMRDSDEAAIVRERETLNTLYDAFTAKFGLISSRENSIAFSQDNAYYLLCSLEPV